jgi:hypothetical protein
MFAWYALTAAECVKFVECVKLAECVPDLVCGVRYLRGMCYLSQFGRPGVRIVGKLHFLTKPL